MLDGQILACTPQCLEQGVHLGDTVSRAQSVCPDLRVFTHDGLRCELAWQEALLELYRYTPRIEPLAPGQALAELRNNWRASQLAHSLQASIGQAASRNCALLAAISQFKPGVVYVAESDQPQFMAQLPTALLQKLGISTNSVDTMNWLGIYRLGQLGALSKAQLTSQFAEGLAIYRLLNEPDTTPVQLYEPPPSLDFSQKLYNPSPDLNECHQALQKLAKQAVEELGARSVRSIQLSLQLENQTHACQRMPKKKRPSTQELTTLLKVMLNQLLQKSPLNHEQAWQSLHLQFTGLVEPTSTQGQLWPEKLSPRAAIDNLVHRFPGKVLLTRQLRPWCILPEEAFVFEPVTPGESDQE